MGEEFEISVTNVLEALSRILLYDTSLFWHSIRVGELAYQLGQRIQLQELECVRLYYAGLLHDYGKIFIPKEVLLKPEKLTVIERCITELHVWIGIGHLNNICKDKIILDAILNHHERLNGRGYPCRKKEYSIYGKILNVADVYDALTHSRCYKEALSIQESLAIIDKEGFENFDERVVIALHGLVETKGY